MVITLARGKTFRKPDAGEASVAAEIDHGGDIESAGWRELLVKKDLAEEEGIAASLPEAERMLEDLERQAMDGLPGISRFAPQVRGEEEKSCCGSVATQGDPRLRHDELDAF